MAKEGKDVATKEKGDRRDAATKDRPAKGDKKDGAPEGEQAAAAAKAAPRKKRERRVVPRGAAHIKASFNNTIISISDPVGNVIAWSSAGASGWKGSRKSTPYAAQVAAENAARKAIDTGMKTVEVFVRGPGAGRELHHVRSRPGRLLAPVDDVEPDVTGKHPGGALAGLRLLEQFHS